MLNVLTFGGTALIMIGAAIAITIWAPRAAGVAWVTAAVGAFCAALVLAYW